jgi:hypothetical protein
VLDLSLVEFRELFVQLRHCFGLLSNQMTVQSPPTQGFDSLGNNLIVGYLWGLGFQLQEPLVEIGECLLLSLRT